VLHVPLDNVVGELAADHSLRVEDGVRRVHCGLVLRGVANQALIVREGNIGRGCPIAHLVRDDVNAVVAEDANAGIGCSEVNSNCFRQCLEGK
jgi:hypothetical protein